VQQRDEGQEPRQRQHADPRRNTYCNRETRGGDPSQFETRLEAATRRCRRHDEAHILVRVAERRGAVLERPRAPPNLAITGRGE
jgi:hypothetical protein